VQAADRLLHGIHRAAQVGAFQSSGDSDIALQVLAPDLGLPGKFSERCERTEGWPFCRRRW